MTVLTFENIAPQFQSLLQKQHDVCQMDMRTTIYEMEADLFHSMLDVLTTEERVAFVALVSVIDITKAIRNIVSRDCTYFSREATIWIDC